MILTREEILFLDVCCHEGTEAPFGGPATDAMRSIGIQNGDTLGRKRWGRKRWQEPLFLPSSLSSRSSGLSSSPLERSESPHKRQSRLDHNGGANPWF